ncbi:MAG: agmatinase [Methanomicrobiales archaeon]
MLFNTHNNSKFAFSLDDNKYDHSNMKAEFDNNNCFGIVGVPFDSTSTYRTGSRYGPLVVREASYNFERYNLTFNKSLNVPVLDFGDVEVVPGNFIKTCKKIESTVQELKDKNFIPILLGGEHSLTYPALKTMEIEDVTVIHLDAHMDLLDSYMGERYSHATVMKRVYDLNPEHIIQIGIRSCALEEKIFSNENGIDYYTSNDVYNNFNNILTQISRIEGKIYITVDIDVLDPSFAPSSGNPTPGGLNPVQVEKIISYLSKKDVIGFDLVEVATNQLGDITAVNAAKILYDFLCLKS